eukprot:4641737-Amphidinium_carterae.2
MEHVRIRYFRHVRIPRFQHRTDSSEFWKPLGKLVPIGRPKVVTDSIKGFASTYQKRSCRFKLFTGRCVMIPLRNGIVKLVCASALWILN